MDGPRAGIADEAAFGFGRRERGLNLSGNGHEELTHDLRTEGARAASAQLSQYDDGAILLDGVRRIVGIDQDIRVSEKVCQGVPHTDRPATNSEDAGRRQGWPAHA